MPARIVRKRGEGGDEQFSVTKASLQKRFGESAFHVASEHHQPDRIPTGIFMLDLALLGGIPHNRVSMIVGEKHAGKSTVADKVIAGAQKQFPDSIIVKVDVEGTHDSVWSEKLGVDLDRLFVLQPETGESAIDGTDALVRTKEVSLIVVDSIAALTPMKEIEASAEDAFMGLAARMIGSMVRKVTAGLIAERNRDHYVTVLLLNQFRSKLGMTFGDPRSIPGGKALEYATSVQLIIKNKENMGKDAYEVETPVENIHVFEVKKNKLSAGPRTGEFRLLRVDNPHYGLSEGDIEDAGTLLTYSKKFGAYTGGGRKWVLSFWDEEHVFPNEEEAKIALYADPALYWKLRNFLICQQAMHLGMPADFYERFYPD